MKARIRATGDIYNVIDMNDYRNRFKLEDHNWYTMGEIELIEGNEPDRQQTRIQASIAAMQGMLANPQTFEQIDHDEGYKEVFCGDKTKIVAKASVMYADALIAELKRSDDVYAECRRMDAINTASVCENMTKIQNELQKKRGQDGAS